MICYYLVPRTSSEHDCIRRKDSLYCSWRLQPTETYRVDIGVVQSLTHERNAAAGRQHRSVEHAEDEDEDEDQDQDDIWLVMIERKSREDRESAEMTIVAQMMHRAEDRAKDWAPGQGGPLTPHPSRRRRMSLPRCSCPTVSIHSHLPVVGDLRQLPLRRRPTASSTPSLPSRIVSITPRAVRSHALVRHAPASSCQEQVSFL